MTESQGLNHSGNNTAQGPSPADLQVAQVSDTGRARTHNEDYVDHYVPRDPEQLATKGAIYLVADGMGGHQAGEVASRAAVELVIEQYYADANPDIGTCLVRAFRAANRTIYEQAQADLTKGGMGTTLVAAVIVGSKVYVASVGDSRVYLIGSGGIAQITEDHSWVQEQVRAGLLTPEQARQHPQRNVVTRALGSRPSVDVDLFQGQLGEGDALLLCSDGLSGLIEDRELQAVVQSQPAQEAARNLVAMANERGGVDNITVLIVHTRHESAAPVATTGPLPVVTEVRAGAGTRDRRGPLVPLLIGALALLALLAAVWFIVLPWLEGAAPSGTATTTPALPTGTAIQSPLSTGTAVLTAVAPTTVPTTTLTLPPGSPTVTLIPTRTPTPQPPPATGAPTATGQPAAPAATVSPQPPPVTVLPSQTTTAGP